jgi:predicted transposase/invertase (TIGR01784 family)
MRKEPDIEIPEILPPSEDGVFKTLLTHPDASRCLQDIIASNIDLPVKKATVRNTELPIGDVLEKRERFDVSCEIDGGGQVNVEMQADPAVGDNLTNKHKNIRSRAIYNVCDLHSSQKGIGIPYGKLVRTYQITFCGYTVFEERESCFNYFSFRNAEGEELLDTVSILFVELSKLKRVMEKLVSEITDAEMWAIFLACADKAKYKDLLDEIMAVKEEIKMAYDLLTSISQNEDERARFRARRKFQMDMEHTRIVTFEEGKKEGRTEGWVEGKKEGRTEGWNDGRTDGKLELARDLLASGVSLEIIVKKTGFSPEEIQALKE